MSEYLGNECKHIYITLMDELILFIRKAALIPQEM